MISGTNGWRHLKFRGQYWKLKFQLDVCYRRIRTGFLIFTRTVARRCGSLRSKRIDETPRDEFPCEENRRNGGKSGRRKKRGGRCVREIWQMVDVHGSSSVWLTGYEKPSSIELPRRVTNSAPCLPWFSGEKGPGVTFFKHIVVLSFPHHRYRLGRYVLRSW